MSSLLLCPDGGWGLFRGVSLTSVCEGIIEYLRWRRPDPRDRIFRDIINTKQFNCGSPTYPSPVLSHVASPLASC